MRIKAKFLKKKSGLFVQPLSQHQFFHRQRKGEQKLQSQIFKAIQSIRQSFDDEIEDDCQSIVIIISARMIKNKVASIVILASIQIVVGVARQLPMFRKPQISQQSSNDSLSDDDGCVEPGNNTDGLAGFGNCQQDGLYYLTLGIGTPPQYFNLQFDTGSDLLWITTQASGNPSGFNPNLSSTYEITTTPQNITYINGAGVYGYHGTDTVQLPDTIINNITCPILFADEIKGLSFPASVLGLVGMGYTTIPNFLDLSYEAGLIKTNTFALSLRNYSEDSWLYFDEIPEYIVENSRYSSVVGSGYWQVKLIGVLAGQNDLTGYAARVAVIDSGTSLFYLNPDLQQAFIDQYLPTTQCNFTDGLNICNCSIFPTLPTLTFLFPEVGVHLSPEDYVQAFGDTCYVHIYQVVREGDPEVLLGDTLFMNYNITFNKESSLIGFNGDIENVEIFGSQQFVISQYVVGALSIALLIWALFLAYYLSAYKPRELLLEKEAQIQAGLQQRYTELSNTLRVTE